MDPESPPRVVVVGREGPARASLGSALETEGLAVLAEASQLETIPTIARQQADVFVVCDERLLASPDARSALRDAAVVLLSDMPDPGRMFGAHTGGWGVLPVRAPAWLVAAVVRTAAAGFATVPVTGSARPGTAVPGSLMAEGDQHDEPLTPREREVLALLADGLSNRAIAARLGISEHTVKFHVSTIYGKLGAANRAEAVALGWQRGLIAI